MKMDPKSSLPEHNGKSIRHRGIGTVEHYGGSSSEEDRLEGGDAGAGASPPSVSPMKNNGRTKYQSGSWIRQKLPCFRGRLAPAYTPLDKEDDAKGDAGNPLSQRARLLVAVLFAVGFVSSLVCYCYTLAAIPTPQDIQKYLPGFAVLLGVSVVIFVIVILSAILGRRRLGNRFAYSTYAVGFLQSLGLYIFDHGTNLRDHGFYNFFMFSLASVGGIAAILLGKWMYRNLSTRRIAVILITIAVTVFIYSLVSVARFKQTWTSSITGLTMVPRGDNVPVPRYLSAEQGFTTEDLKWEGCNYPYSDIKFPIMDVTPTGTQNFWSGDWWNCPAPPLPGFTVAMTVDWEGFAPEMRKYKLDKPGETASAEDCESVPDDRPPVHIDISGCPVEQPLMLIALPDTRKLSVPEKHEFKVQDAVLEKIQRKVIRLDPNAIVEIVSDGHIKDAKVVTSADGDVQVVVPTNVDSEIFEVVCGVDTRYVLAPRPPLSVMFRLKQQNPAADFGRLLPTGNGDAPIELPAPNIVILNMDAVSRTHMKRKMPRTVDTLRELGGLAEAKSLGKAKPPPAAPMHVFEYMRSHAVGFTTGENTVPLYTGCHHETPCNDPVFEKFSRDGGYASIWVAGMCEDWAGSFPRYSTMVDHEALAQVCVPEAHPFGQPFGVLNGPYSIRRRCLGGQYVHKHMMTYIEASWDLYNKVGIPVYIHSTFLEGHEGTGEVLGTLDGDFAALLDRLMREKGGADNSVVFVVADHGLHMGLPFLWFIQGRIEHMNPALFVAVPRKPQVDALSSLLSTDVLTNMAANQHALVSSYDLFWTWRQLADLRDAPGDTCAAKKIDLRSKRANFGEPEKASSFSLFEAIPYSRDCWNARIPPNHCKCT